MDEERLLDLESEEIESAYRDGALAEHEARRMHAAIEEAAALIKGMCDLYGAEVRTGYVVAGLIAEGLTSEWVKKQTKQGESEQ